MYMDNSPERTADAVETASLTRAPRPLRIALVACPAWAVWAPHPALPLLSANLRREGHEVFCCDINIEAFRALPAAADWWKDENSIRWETAESVDGLWERNAGFFSQAAEAVAETRPDLVCFTVNSGSRFVSRKMATALRALLPRTPIIFGGADCFRSEYGVRHLENGAVDALCTGEGDLALPALAAALGRYGRIPEDQPGFLVRTPSGIRDNGDPARVTKLDELAPVSAAGIDLTRYTLPNRMTLSISRGCINRCAFCSEGPNQGGFRTHSAAYIEKELEAILPVLKRAGKPHVNFNDSLINGSLAVLSELCDRILARGWDFTWGGMAYVREELTPEFMRKLRSAGCVEICWGIESGSERVLQLMRKRFSAKLLERVVRDTAEAGIAQYGNLIVGFPGEGPREFAESLYFLVQNVDRLTSVGLPLCVIRLNSPLAKEPEAFGLADTRTDLWSTKDGRNTHKIRLLRRKIMEGVLQAKMFDQGRIAALQASQAEDLADPELLREHAEIFREFIAVTRERLRVQEAHPATARRPEPAREKELLTV